jgi:5-methylcytosine-specific restriction endonuclease McrA
MIDFPNYSSLKTFDEWSDEWYSINCGEHWYEYVYKIGETGRITLYRQCSTCGKKHPKGVFKHSEVVNLKEKIQNNQINKYDEDLENDGPTWNRFYLEYKTPEMDRIKKEHEEQKIQEQNKYVEEQKEKRDTWFKEHSEYLQTLQWKNIRQKVLKRDNFLCQGCLEAQATEVHHITYANWKNELMFELMSVCYNCHHNRIHKK